MDVLYNLKQYFSFKKKEFRDLFVTAIFIGFVFSFTEWGVDVFDLYSGFYAWFNAFLVAVLAVLFRIAVQKTFAVYLGYKANYGIWMIGLLAGLFAVFFTNGFLLIAIPGTVSVVLIERFRLGKRRQGLMRRDEALIAFSGPLASIILAMIFQGISGIAAGPLVQKVVLVNMWMAVYTVLPIPYLDGFKIFYYSRTLGLFSVLFFAGIAVFLTWYSFWQTIAAALVLAVLVTIVYFIKFEL
jgi:hypothetical protein